MFVTQFPVRGNYLAKNRFLGGRSTVIWRDDIVSGLGEASWHDGGILVDRVPIGSCPPCEELQEHRPFSPDQRAISRQASS